MCLVKNPNGVLGAGDAGLAAILVPKGTTGTPAVVKKRKIGVGILSPGGLGAVRVHYKGPVIVNQYTGDERQSSAFQHHDCPTRVRH